jgi:YfiH family protein
MSVDNRFEFPLAQGWSKGLRLGFESPSSIGQMPLRQLRVKQVHGDRILSVTPSLLPKDDSVIQLTTEADGLVAEGDWFCNSRTALVVATADCCPLIYVDRLKQCVAIVHAGWRGLQKGVHLQPFESGRFDPISTWIWMGPSLNGASFEVGSDMFSQFSSQHQKNAAIFAPSPHSADKRFFYPWQLLEIDFQRIGVELFYNVEVDTLTSPHFASYRRLKGDKTHRHSNFSWVGFC